MLWNNPVCLATVNYWTLNEYATRCMHCVLTSRNSTLLNVMGHADWRNLIGLSTRINPMFPIGKLCSEKSG